MPAGATGEAVGRHVSGTCSPLQPCAQTAPHVAVPFTLRAADTQCLAWYHVASEPWRDLSIVMCAPVGSEAVRAYATQVQLARWLAESGFPVLRFDYPATGDSAGNDQDPGLLATWRDSIDAAVAQARILSGAANVALLGTRLGATLALEAACRLGTIRRLVLWAPLARGRSFVRELIAVGTPSADGSLHSQGQSYSAETLSSLSCLDILGSRSPAEGVLLIERDDLPNRPNPLAQQLTAAGAQVEHAVWPGFARMAVGGTAGALGQDSLHSLAKWLGEAAPLRDDAARVPRLEPATWNSPDCRERLLQLAGGSLCGVLSEPMAPIGARACEPLVMLLNVGEDYRVGPHRVSVSIARALATQGHRVVRLDCAGMGDSAPIPGAVARPYRYAAVSDVRAAMDALACSGARAFVLAGLCSGAYLAYQTALVDPRVRAIALLNARLLDWPGQMQGTGSWDSAPQIHARTLLSYVRAALTLESRRRFLQGEFGPTWALRRIGILVAARLHQLAWLLGRGGPPLRIRMLRLCAAGVRVLALVGDADLGRGYMEHHFGVGGRAMRRSPKFEMRYLGDADHTFSRPGNAARVGVELAAFLRSVRPDKSPTKT